MIFVFLLSSCVSEIEPRNFAPAVQIISPESDALYNAGEKVPFEVAVSDPDGMELKLVVQLQSDVDGFFWEGSPDSGGGVIVLEGGLSAGEHVVRVLVSDQQGLFVEDSVDLNVNTLPPRPLLQLTPSNPTPNDEIVLTISVEDDADGDTLTPMIAWYRNGNVVETATDLAEISSTDTSKNDVWLARVCMSDGKGVGECGEASISIGNSAPTMERVTIEPDSMVYNDSVLLCTGQASDNDGDPVTYAYGWEVLSEGTVSELMDDTNTLVLNSNLAAANSRVYCIASASDDATEVSATVYVDLSNRDPRINDLVLFPGTEIRDGTELNCSATIDDPDFDVLTTSYRWENNGAVLSVEPVFTFTSSMGAKGDTLTCEVTVIDQHGASTSSQDTVTVSNTPPQVTQTSLLPQSPTTLDVVQCLATATDVDQQDAVSLLYTWEIDGILQQETTNTLSGPFNVGAQLTCRVTPTDGDSNGDPASVTTTVENSPPAVVEIQFTQTEVFTNDILEAVVITNDADQDNVSLVYEWYVNGVSVLNGPGHQLNGVNFFDKDDQVYVEVTPSDGRESGSTFVSNALIVSNSPPTDPEIEVSFGGYASDGEDLTCTVISPSVDADGDPFTYTVTWEQSGAPLSELAQSTSVLENDTVSSFNTNPGDVYRCTVVADDGLDSGVEASVDTTVTSCGVLYTYELGTDFHDLENIPDCWSASTYSSTFDINTSLLSPMSTVYDCLDGHALYDSGCWEEEDYQVLTNGVSWGALIYNYLSTDVSWTHGAYNIAESLLPELNVLPPALVVWRAPLGGDCNVNFDLVGVGALFGSSTISLVVYHEEQLVHQEDVTGSISNLSLNVPMQAGDTLSFVFGADGPFNYDFSGISQDGGAYVSVGGDIQCVYSQ